jgi:hypothetical protein
VVEPVRLIMVGPVRAAVVEPVGAAVVALAVVELVPSSPGGANVVARPSSSWSA